jgi:hypothetical protein
MKETQHEQQKTQSMDGLWFLNNQNQGQNEKFGRSWVCVRETKLGKWGNKIASGGGVMVVVMTGGWVEVKRCWVLVVWGLGVWEMREKMEKMGERAVRRKVKVRGRREESGPKIGHVRVLNVCDQSHQGAFDSIRARMCVMWASALEQTRVSSNAIPCL